METIFKNANYEREFVFSSYAKYAKEKDAFYLFSTGSGLKAVSFEKCKVYTAYDLAKELKASHETFQLSQSEQLPYSLSNTSLSDIYLNLFELEPFQDEKEIFLTKTGKKTLLLSYDENITGYAYLDDDGTTKFVCSDFGFWSNKKNNINNNQSIIYTDDIKKVLYSVNENYILGKPDFLHLNLVIEKFDYQNIKFDNDYLWFLGNVIYLNNNTVYSVKIFEKENDLILFSNKKLECMSSFLEHSHPFENRYHIKKDEDIFKEIVNEINKTFNLPVINKETDHGTAINI